MEERHFIQQSPYIIIKHKAGHFFNKIEISSALVAGHCYQKRALPVKLAAVNLFQNRIRLYTHGFSRSMV